MTTLPPPRLPGQPPDRPPIRRPDDHLPLPDRLGAATPVAIAERPRNRVRLLVGLLAAVTIVVAGGGAILLAGGDDRFNTQAVADAIDDAVVDMEQDGEGADCPLDDVNDLLGKALAPLDSDDVYDVLDLGQPSASSSLSRDDEPPYASCIISHFPAGGSMYVGIAVTAVPDDFLEYSVEEARDFGGDVDVEEGDDFHGGRFSRQLTTGADGDVPAFLQVNWTNDHIGISILIAGTDIEDLDADAVEHGLGDVIPEVAEQLEEAADD